MKPKKYRTKSLESVLEELKQLSAMQNSFTLKPDGKQGDSEKNVSYIAIQYQGPLHKSKEAGFSFFKHN